MICHFLKLLILLIKLKLIKTSMLILFKGIILIVGVIVISNVELQMHTRMRKEDDKWNTKSKSHEIKA